MKILFCAYDEPGHVATGPNVWLQRLIPELIHKFNLQVETLFFHPGKLDLCPTIRFFNEKKLPVHLINRRITHYTEDQVKAILHIVKKQSITVVVSNLVVAGFYAAKYLRRYQIPSIAVIHSNDSFYNGVIQKFISSYKYGSLSHAVCVSDYLYKLAQQNNANKTILKVIPCGTPFIPQVKKRPQSKKLKIIYAGRIEIEQKQILLLAKSFVKSSLNNKNLSFSIYGSGSQVQELEQFLSPYKNTANVKFYGSVPQSEIQKVMLEHDVFTLMSDYEGMPVALMEAMACGLVPVCLKEESGINEIIKSGENGFIVQNRNDDYFNKLSHLQKSPELLENMSLKAMDTIKVKYNLEQTHKKWADLLLNFKDNTPGNIRLPRIIRIKGPLLPYGEYRKPGNIHLLKNKAKHVLLDFRAKTKPFTRIRKLITSLK